MREGIRPYARRALPQTSAQQRLWFLHAYEPDDAGYNIASAYRLQGPLDVEALRVSLLDLDRRHPALRACFPLAEEGPVQVVGPPGRLVLEETRTEGRDLGAMVASAFRRSFDLERGPVIRAQLIRVTAEEYVLVLVLHHIVCDQRSWGILLRDLRRLYDARRRGEHPSLPAPSARYQDYAMWERQQLTDALVRRQLTYWERHLARPVPALDLLQRAEGDPPGRARPTRSAVDLPSELCGRAQAFAREESTTPFVVFLALYAATVSRLQPDEEVAVGCPVARRDMPGSEELVGFFVNLVALRIPVLPGSSLRAITRRSRDVVIDALDNSQIPYQEVVARLIDRGSHARAPLFEVSFNLLDEAGDEEFGLDGLEVRPYPAVEPGVRHTLSLILTLRAGSAEMRGVFDAARVSAPKVDELLASYRQLAALALDAPDQAIAEMGGP